MTVEFGVVVPTWGAFGDPAKIRRLVRRAWAGNPAAGIEDALDQMERFAARVLPRFAGGR